MAPDPPGSGQRTVLITGGTGFIGERLVASLAPAARVRLLARRVRPAALTAAVDWLYASDLADAAALASAMRGVDVVVHLASVVHRPNATRDEFQRGNVQLTHTLARAAIEAGAGHFIFLSSVAAVGLGDDGVVGDRTSPRPITPYGESKLEAERALLAACAGTQMIASVIRPPVVYGPGMKGNPLRLFRALTRGLPLPLGRASNPRSVVFVDNLVAYMCALVRRTPEHSDVYYVADSELRSIAEFARASAQALGVRARLLPSPYRMLKWAGRMGGRFPLLAKIGFTAALAEAVGGKLVLDTSRIERVAGFAPPFSQAEGLAATAQWFRAAHRR